MNSVTYIYIHYSWWCVRTLNGFVPFFLEHVLACCAGISLHCLHYLLSLQNHHQHHHHHHHHADAGASVQFLALLLILPQRHTWVFSSQSTQTFKKYVNIYPPRGRATQRRLNDNFFCPHRRWKQAFYIKDIICKQSTRLSWEFNFSDHMVDPRLWQRKNHRCKKNITLPK